MKLKIWTVAADDDNGTRATVHLTKKQAYEQWLELRFSGELDHDETAERAAAWTFIDHEDYESLWEWAEDRQFGDPLDTYTIDEHEIDVPTAQDDFLSIR